MYTYTEINYKNVFSAVYLSIYNIIEKILLLINNKKWFLHMQISILEWFLKDHGTLKTGVINSALPSQEYITF